MVRVTISCCNYVVIIDDDSIYLKERTAKDIWIGLYDFPLIESEKQLDTFNIINDSFKKSALELQNKSPEFKHILSHQKIYATFWLVTAKKTTEFDSIYTKTPLVELNNFPVPKLIDNYLQTIL